MMENRNMTMLCDFYELTMQADISKTICTGEMRILMCFSAPSRTAAVLLSQQVLRR
mgnify:CR=1 FL=1